MKKKTLLLCCILSIFFSLKGQQTNLAYFPFNYDAAQQVYLATAGTQTGTAGIYANGTHGSSTWDLSTELNTFSGSSINLLGTEVAGKALALVDSTANGKSIVLHFSTADYQNVIISFATKGTPSGFTSHTWYYSTDSVNFTLIPNTATINTDSPFALRTLNLSAITAINDQADVYLRLTLSGANSTSGNNRIDNLQINAEPAGADTYAPFISDFSVQDSSTLQVTFSEEVTTLTAENTSNYVITGHTVTSATLTSNTVALSLTPALTEGVDYTLSIANVADLAGNIMTDTSFMVNYGVSAANTCSTLTALRAKWTSNLNINANTVGNTVYKFSGEATVTSVNPTYRHQVTIQDATAAIIIDDNNALITRNLQVGDKITGVYGTLTDYYGLLQFNMSQDCSPVISSGNTIEPLVVTLTDLQNVAYMNAHQSELTTIENVTFTATGNFSNGTKYALSNGTETVSNAVWIRIYNEPTLTGTAIPTTAKNITGFNQISYGDYCIIPRNGNDLSDPVLPPVFSVVTPQDGAVFEAGDSILLTFDIQNFAVGTDGYVKIETPLLTQMGLSDPYYLNQMDIMYLSQFYLQFSQGTYTVIASLVGMDSVSISPETVDTLTFTINPPVVATPVFTPAAGIYDDTVYVSILCDTEGATLYYTTDGTVPTSSSAQYTAPIQIAQTTTVKAIATKTNFTNSAVATAEYEIVYEPLLVVSPTAVTLTDRDNSTTISVSGFYLTSPIILTCDYADIQLSHDTLPSNASDSAVTLTFNGNAPGSGILVISGGTLTDTVFITTYTTVSTPVFVPNTMSNSQPFDVTITCSTPGAQIYYTTDESVPTTLSTLYTAPITITQSTTVKAVAAKEGWLTSNVAEAAYEIILPPVLTDTIIYRTGFEASEEFAASTNYSNTVPAYTGSEGQQWETVFGTPSTTSPISGAQSMQMRWYTASATSLAYTLTSFDLSHATRVTFLAKNTNNLMLNVSHSTDGGITFNGDSLYTVSQQAMVYSYQVSETGAFDNVRIKFSVVLPETAPTGTSRLYLDSVVVFGMLGMPETTAATPVISPVSGLFFEPQAVTMTCRTEGAIIRYTTDGSIPTETSTLYDTAFTVSGTSVIKAKAWKSELTPSNLATVTLNFPVEVPDIAAFKAASSATNTTPYKITGDVIYVFGSGANKYIQDSTGALLIYDNNNIIAARYFEGDIIHGGIYGTYSLYNGLVEMVPNHDCNVSLANIGTVSPSVTSIAEIETNYAFYESRFVRINQVVLAGGTFTTESSGSISFTQGVNEMTLRNTFKTLSMTVPADTIADVIGFVSIYNTDYQLSPRNNDDILYLEVEQVPTPVIAPEAGSYDETVFPGVTISCTDEEATIRYTDDGSEPTEASTIYTGTLSFTVLEDTQLTVTVKAKAYKEGLNPSETATSTYIIDNSTSINEYVSGIKIYPNPAKDFVVISLPNNTTASVELVNAAGQVLYYSQPNESETTIDLENYSSGLYFIRIKSDKQMIIRKIVK